MPILGEWILATGTVRITFDKPLVPGAYDERNYNVRWVNVGRDPGSASVPGGAPTRLLISTSVDAPDFGIDRCEYIIGAADLIGQNGRLVEPFIQPLVGV